MMVLSGLMILFYACICMFAWHICLSTMRMTGAHGSWKRASLDLHVFWLVLGIKPGSSARASLPKHAIFSSPSLGF